MDKTIVVKESTKEELTALKEAKWEPYDAVIQRLIEKAKGKNEPQAARLGGSTE
jgi:predicted CopG family antitoxin